MRQKILLAVLVFVALLITVWSVTGMTVTAENENAVYLSDLKASEVSVGWGELHLDEGLDGAKLKISDGKGGFVTYDKGICAHAPSELCYDLSDGSYTRFLAEIGIHYGSNNGAKDAASVTFTVEADGKVIFQSEVYRIGSAAGHVDVEIPAGTQMLTLITTDAGDGNSGDHSSWANARLEMGKIDPDALKSLELPLPTNELLVGNSLQLNPRLQNYAGSEIPLTEAKIEYLSGDPDAMTVDGKGRVTCKAPGSTILTVRATVGDVTLEKKLTLRGYTETDPAEQLKGEFASPDGSVALSYSLDRFGSLHFSVTESGCCMLPDALVGIVTAECDFSDGLRFLSKNERELDESYRNISGKHSEVRNHAKICSLQFEKAAYLFTVELRAYDDGFAYRYSICRKDGKNETLTVQQESGYFALDGDSSFYAIPITNTSSPFNHEASYAEKKVSNFKSGYVAFPLLNRVGNNWMLLSEAELYGDLYVGSILRGVGDNKLQLQFAPKSNKNTEVEIALEDDGFTSPWRFGITGTGLGEIIESDLTENLHTRTDKDYSWVEPGVTAWMWLSEGFAGQRDKKTVYEYIDLAAEMGWKYLILDEGWQPGAPAGSGRRYAGYFSWFDDMIAYAAERGVGIIAWVLCNDLDTPEEREILREWAEKGIKGIKVDFFDSEDQAHIGYYQAIYDACAEVGLLVNCHGSNKPTGERQYWPNVINREAVNGEEYGGYSSSDLNVWAFTRNVVGPMDLTPRMNPSSWSQTTVASQMAMNVVFECGIPCMGSAANEYLSSPARSFYQNLPAAWDDLHFIDGYPCKYTVLARRSGDHWYVGGLTVGKREFTLQFGFLPEGETYMAYIYRDGDGKYDLVTERIAVKKGDSLTIPMLAGGGFSVKLLQVTAQNRLSYIEPNEAIYTLPTEGTLALAYTTGVTNAGDYLLWSCADPAIATVDENGRVHGVFPGETEVYAAYVGDPKVKATFKIRVTAGEQRRFGSWSVKNETVENRGSFSSERENALVLQTLTGDICGSATNIWNLEAPTGDFTAIVTVMGRFGEEDQTAGLILYSDSQPGKAVAIARRYFQSSNCFDFYSFNGEYTHKKQAEKKNGAVYLRVERKNAAFLGAVSYDGKEWISLGSINMQLLAGCSDLRIGVYAGSGTCGAVKNVTFMNFTLNGSVIPFAVAGDTPVLAEISSPEPVEATVGTAFDALQLPETVIVRFSDGSKGALPVVWTAGDYQSDTVGSYTLNGTISDCTTENPQKLSASLTVKTKEAEPTGEEPQDPADPAREPERKTQRVILTTAICLTVAAGCLVAVLVKRKKTAKTK